MCKMATGSNCRAMDRIRSELGPEGTTMVCRALKILTEEISR